MMAGTQMPLVPKLRFPEFRDVGPWKAKRLGDRDIAKFIRDRIPVAQIPLGNYVGTANILPDFGGLSPIAEIPSSIGAVAYLEGDILISNIRPYLKKIWIADRSGGASNDVLIARPGRNALSDFLGHFLMSDRFIFYVMSGTKGVKMPRGDIEQIQDFIVPLPDKAEQRKIADCLTALDDLIRAEKDSITALNDHKRGLMQNLFPAPGETTPNLRFPEYRDAQPWKAKRLGEVGTIFKGKGIAKSDIAEEGSLSCIRYGELYTRYSEVIRETASFTNLDPDDLILSEKNDLLIPASGETKEDIATASCVMNSGIALGSDLNIFRSSINGIFLAYYVRGALKSLIEKIAQGISVIHLYPVQIEALTFAVPALPEQRKIADCLTALDDLIRAEEDSIAALNDHKRGLMQHLFPSPDRVPAFEKDIAP